MAVWMNYHALAVLLGIAASMRHADLGNDIANIARAAGS